MNYKATYYQSNTKINANLYVCQNGWQICGSEHYFGPFVRDYFVIHYITKGKGKYFVNNKTYHLKKGQGFLIIPGAETFYQADKHDPWQYYWVSFSGTETGRLLNLAGLNEKNLTFNYTKDDNLIKYVENMYNASQKNAYPDVEMIGYLYLFLSCLINEHLPLNNVQNQYFQKAISFIEQNYATKITVSMVSNYVGIDRSYLFRIFKNEQNQSIKEYINSFRISRARDLLVYSELSIEEISNSVGFKGSAPFSKLFKLNCGVSPLKYRNMARKR